MWQTLELLASELSSSEVIGASTARRSLMTNVLLRHWVGRGGRTRSLGLTSNGGEINRSKCVDVDRHGLASCVDEVLRTIDGWRHPIVHGTSSSRRRVIQVGRNPIGTEVDGSTGPAEAEIAGCRSSGLTRKVDDVVEYLDGLISRDQRILIIGVDIKDADPPCVALIILDRHGVVVEMQRSLVGQGRIIVISVVDQIGRSGLATNMLEEVAIHVSVSISGFGFLHSGQTVWVDGFTVGGC